MNKTWSLFWCKTSLYSCNIRRRIFISLEMLTMMELVTVFLGAIFSILVTGFVHDGKFTRSSPDNAWFDSQQISPQGDPDVTHLTPVLTPAVAATVAPHDNVVKRTVSLKAQRRITTSIRRAKRENNEPVSHNPMLFARFLIFSPTNNRNYQWKLPHDIAELDLHWW